MIIFLTSSPSGPLNVPNDEHLLDAQNNFIKNLQKYYQPQMKALMIAAFPNAYSQNDEMTEFFVDCFKHANMSFDTFDLLDNRNKNLSISNYDFVILAGGHVPTQNQFFHDIHLREQFETFDGIVMGISAGTMNSADVVYAQPELEGESRLSFQRYLQGLNLTKLNILPHYQMVKDYYLDGKRLFEEITYPDSYQTPLYCLLDGSYILIKDDETYLYGEAYLIENGKLRLINTKNNVRRLVV